MSDCEGCEKRKEALKKMLGDHRFWLGIAVGVGGCWAYRKFVKKG